MPDPVWNCVKDCGWGAIGFGWNWKLEDPRLDPFLGFGWNWKLEDPRLPELVSLQEELGEMLPWTRLC